MIDNPDSNGIWYDVGNVDGVFVNNWVENANDGFSTSARLFDVEVGTLHVTRGYDNMTGVGTPNGETFLTLLQ